MPGSVSTIRAALLLPIAVLVFSVHVEAQMKRGRMGSGEGGPGQMQSREQEPSSTGVNPEVMGAFIPQRADAASMAARGFLSTGLEAVYPTSHDCPRLTSPFASPTRTDGSQRSRRYFVGLHGGMDIPAPKGTPLLALADGEVIVVHEDGSGIGGLGLWIRHAPEDTGTGKYVFTEYKHIDRLPQLKPGDRVRMGQVLAETGNTGTVGGHYGSEGFYHLHMTAYWSEQADYRFGMVLIPVGGQWLDPLALMRGGPLDSQTLGALPAEQKRVTIPFMSSDGRFYPEGTKVVWPYACTPKS